MLMTSFYTEIAELLAGRTSRPLNMMLAIGEGDPVWDARPVPPTRDLLVLHREIARQRVSDVGFVDSAGAPSRSATTRVRFSTSFEAGRSTTALRECGLFGPAGRQRGDPGRLLSSFRHPRINFASGSVLERAIIVDLEPLPFTPGAVPTRWLGNNQSREMHDVDHLTGPCQAEEIRDDHIYYLADFAEADRLDYDRCAHCFGRDQSER